MPRTQIGEAVYKQGCKGQSLVDLDPVHEDEGVEAVGRRLRTMVARPAVEIATPWASSRHRAKPATLQHHVAEVQAAKARR